MGRRKTADQFFNQSIERGSDKAKSGINGKTVHKPLSAKEKRAIERIYELWDRWLKDHPEAHDEDLLSLKKFMRDVAFGIDGMEGVKEGDKAYPGQGTVLRYWKDFTRRRFREDRPLPKLITASVTNYIKIELPKDLPMPVVKRPRRYGTKTHLIQFGTHFWSQDAHEYAKPAQRVYDWASIMIIVCSSSRIGEYFESSSRPGSERGLHYRDVQFVVFWNENKEVEFAFQGERDAKNMTAIPHRRPQHVVYEGIGPMPLFLNPLLPHLAFLIATRAFKHYETLEQLLDAKPRLGDNITQLEWSDDHLDKPFYPSTSGTGVEKANALGIRFKAAFIRAGFISPPRVHDFRAEGLTLVDALHTAAQRMKYAGQTDPSTHNNHYAPNLAADGQGAFFSGETRPAVLNLFRDLSVPRNSQLCQELPAEQKEKFESSQVVVNIKSELAGLRGCGDIESVTRCKQLHQKKRKLEAKELRKWQRSQGHDDRGSPGQQSLFDRVRFLIPELSRLSVSLFESVPLRSPVGIQSLRDMISLCNMESVVRFRPGLEPDKCGCQPTQTPYNWRHIYMCYRQQHPEGKNFCFLCHEWFHGEEEWRAHCQAHLSEPDRLPLECDPLIYGQVLAAPGLCEFCLGNTRLAPELRIKQFLYRDKWIQHRKECSTRYLHKGLFKCPHPRHREYPIFETMDQLRYHCFDIHRGEIPAEGSQGRKHPCENESRLPEPKQKKQKLSTKRDYHSPIPTEYTFLNVTAQFTEKGSSRQTLGLSKTLHHTGASDSVLYEYSETHDSPLSSVFSDDFLRGPSQGYDSPLSSIGSDELENLEAIYCADQVDLTVECPMGAADGIKPAQLNVYPAIDPQLQGTYDSAAEASELGNEDGEAESVADPEYESLTLPGALLEDQGATQEPVAIDNADNIWAVETILAIWPRKDGTVRYLIKWEGFPHNRNTWEPQENVSDDDIRMFNATYTGNQLVEVLKKRQGRHTMEYLVRWTAQWEGAASATKSTWLEEPHVSEEKVMDYHVKEALSGQKKARRKHT